MPRLLRKRKQGDRTAPQDILMPWLIDKVKRFRRLWADFMQRQTERLSVRGKQVIVISICVLSAVYCSHVIYQSFHSRRSSIFSVTPIHTPSLVTHTGEANAAGSTIMPEAQYRQISNFRKYIDSLNTSVYGKSIADSLLRLRPRLMDSIRQLEAIHNSQSLKK